MSCLSSDRFRGGKIKLTHFWCGWVRDSEYRIPHHSEMATLSLSQDFLALTERVKRDLNITLIPSVDRTGTGEETVLRFCLNRSNVDFLATARDLVQEFLVARNVSFFEEWTV